ncbi:TatD family hydrolase [Undibacterium sp.]|uniref:TatD family hydrolase n=1 Tax=Undibacterium sp. TaxID=1914977 RepID=UPI0025D98AF3|nr:TatD family hydrolase [Undibacterium sp.]
MWIDSHCHLDAAEFAGQSLAVAQQAASVGVSSIVIPAVHPSNFSVVAELAQNSPTCFYTLGIHPMYVPDAHEDALLALRKKVQALISTPALASGFVGIGEIGLDFFVPALKQSPLKEKQEYFFTEQLKIARDFELPVLMHVRRSQDIILKHCRRIKVAGGIAHAFNGSEQQAQAFVGLGFKLGFGGAMTYPRALQIRRLASALPLDAIVLETDAPDIAPHWLANCINSPVELPKIGAVLAQLRGMPAELIAAHTSANVLDALPLMRLPRTSPSSSAR